MCIKSTKNPRNNFENLGSFRGRLQRAQLVNQKSRAAVICPLLQFRARVGFYFVSNYWDIIFLSPFFSLQGFPCAFLLSFFAAVKSMQYYYILFVDGSNSIWGFILLLFGHNFVVKFHTFSCLILNTNCNKTTNQE